MQTVKQTWHEKMAEFAKWEKLERRDLDWRLQMKFDEHLEHMHHKAVHLHFGKEVVDLRCKMKHLGGLQRYAEAAVMQRHADDVALNEREIFQEKQEEQKACGGEG